MWLMYQMIESFLVRKIGQVMAELGIEPGLMGSGIIVDFFGNAFEGFEVGDGIAIAEGVIGNDVEALLEKGLKFRVH